MSVLTCYPGRVISFDKDLQTASVMPAYEKYISNLEVDFQKVDRTPIHNIPVHFIQSGDYAITHAVEEGKPCLIWFAHRGYDHWMEGAMEAGTYGSGLPKGHFMRTHNISDAFITVGFSPSSEPIPDFQNTGIEIRGRGNRDQRITMDAGTIEVMNPEGTTSGICETLNMEATGSATLTCPETTITGNVRIKGNLVVDGTGEFGQVVTAPNFILSGLTLLATAANNLIDIIKYYTGHTHGYSWTDGPGSGNTNTPTDGV